MEVLHSVLNVLLYVGILGLIVDLGVDSLLDYFYLLLAFPYELVFKL